MEMDWGLWAAFALWVLVGTAVAWRQGPAGRLAVLAVWVPLGILIGVTGLTSTPVLLPRRLGFVFAPMVLLMAGAVQTTVIRGGVLGAGAMGGAGVFLALNLWGWCTYLQTPQVWRADWRSIAAETRKVQQPGDILVFCPAYAQIPFNYYYDRERTRYRVADQDGTKVVEFLPGYYEAGGLPQTFVLGPETEFVAEVFSRYPRILLVGNQTFTRDPEGALFKWLNRNTRLVYGVKADNLDPASRVYLGVFERVQPDAGATPAP